MTANVVKVINYGIAQQTHSRTYEGPWKAGWEGVVRFFHFHSQYLLQLSVWIYRFKIYRSDGNSRGWPRRRQWRPRWKRNIHRVGKGRMLSFFSSRRNWDYPTPSPPADCAPPPLVQGGAHSLAGEGVGESQFRRGDIHCGPLHMYVLCGAI